nr:MAG TPA: hypothetical protein [Caudoviricetes sp.]
MCFFYNSRKHKSNSLIVGKYALYSIVFIYFLLFFFCKKLCN